MRARVRERACVRACVRAFLCVLGDVIHGYVEGEVGGGVGDDHLGHLMNINERENDSQNRYVRISILENDVCMIMKQYENKYSENAKSCKALVIMYIHKLILFTFS